MKRNNLLFASAVFNSVYAVYIVCHFFGGMASPDTAEAVGAGLATLLVMPHIICVVAATIFNWIGWIKNKRWAALTAGILDAVSMLLMLLYALFVIVQTILCFVAAAQLKNAVENNVANVASQNNAVASNNVVPENCKFCRKCGTKVDASAKFCSKCGEKF